MTLSDVSSCNALSLRIVSSPALPCAKNYTALVFSPDDWRARTPQDGYDGVIYRAERYRPKLISHRRTLLVLDGLLMFNDLPGILDI